MNFFDAELWRSFIEALRTSKRGAAALLVTSVIFMLASAVVLLFAYLTVPWALQKFGIAALSAEGGWIGQTLFAVASLFIGVVVWSVILRMGLEIGLRIMRGEKDVS